MNNVLLEVNSYTQKVRLFINNRQVDVYSALSNFSYEQILNNPASLLNAISREINDEFVLRVTSNEYEYRIIENDALQNEDCISVNRIEANISLSSRERAEMLGELLPVSSFVVFVPELKNVSETEKYGNVTVSFTTDQTIKSDLSIASGDLILSHCETMLINPLVGKAVDNVPNAEDNIAICSRLTPIVRVLEIADMESGEECKIKASVYPESSELPSISIVSSNCNVVKVRGDALIANAPGVTDIKVFVAGENVPVHSQKITVTKTIFVSKIDFANLNDVQHEGKSLLVNVDVLPHDAVDAQNIKFETSDLSVAEFHGNELVFKKAGTCTIKAISEKTCCSKEILIAPKLKKISFGDKPFSLNLNIGQMEEIPLEYEPSNAYNAEFEWELTDDVCEIINEDGKFYIKAVSIGEAIVTCKAKDGSDYSTFYVSVQSMMYKRSKPINYKAYILAALLCVAFILVKPLINDFTEKRNEEIRLEEQEKLYEGATRIDIFEEIDVSFTGVEGEGIAEVSVISTNPLVQGCNFFILPSAGLSSGQEIEITAIFDEALVQQYGYAPLETTKKLIVPTLNSKNILHTDITPEFIAEIKTKQIDWYNEKKTSLSAGDKYYSYEADIHGVFFQDNKNTDECRIVVIVGGDAYNTRTSRSDNTYVVRTFNDITKDGSGNIICNYSAVSGALISSSTFTTAEDAINSVYADSMYITTQLE